MAIKKKVTYSVQYVAGTDTLTTQLNLLLQDIVSLILSQNTGLTVLDTITVGSARWTGAPLYDTYVSGLIPADDYNNRHYESDVIYIGTDEDNVCLSVGFFDGALVIAMNMSPKVEKDYTDVWSSQYGLSKLPFYATGVMSRWFTTGGSNTGTYALPYRIINDTIAISLIYWDGDYSRGYSFVNGAGETDGVNLVIFPTNEGNNLTGIGFAVCPNTKITTYQQLPGDISIASFAENLSDNRAEVISTGYYANYEPPTPSASIQVNCNAKYDSRNWSYQGPHNVSTGGQKAHRLFQIWHTLGNGDGNINTSFWGYGNPMPTEATIPTGVAIPLTSAYNLPHLNVGQAYVRKMRIPGWNPSCKGEIYLLWSPVLTAYQSGDIVEVGSKSFAIITEGAVCWAARVS